MPAGRDEGTHAAGQDGCGGDGRDEPVGTGQCQPPGRAPRQHRDLVRMQRLELGEQPHE